jgi:hypothetical protein
LEEAVRGQVRALIEQLLEEELQAALATSISRWPFPSASSIFSMALRW